MFNNGLVTFNTVSMRLNGICKITIPSCFALVLVVVFVVVVGVVVVIVVVVVVVVVAA